MNDLNYGSLEACKRLADAGIVLETDCYFAQDRLHDGVFLWECTPEIKPHKFPGALPALSMAEAWRELPIEFLIKDRLCALMMWKWQNYTEVGYWWHEEVVKSAVNTNPTDALIDLLIWVKKEAKP